MASLPCIDPIRCILPPHMLDSIARNGSAGQRVGALNTMAVDHSVRALRFARAMAPRAPTVAAPLTYRNPKPKRSIYSAQNEEDLPGVAVRMEGQKPSGDPAVDEAYDGLGATWDFFFKTFARNSIDGHGMPLSATVHFGQDYDNAYWDGEQMVFGDGDGQIFNRFTLAVDIIGHELTHGVTGVEANLQYVNQSGALNESVSDVFGSLIKQYVRKQTADQADWIIGEGLFTEQVSGVGLRSMKAPGEAYDDSLIGKDPQPGHMRDYVQTTRDNGGVHINSGIPNRAFYLVATAIGGYAWEAPGRIWYQTLRDPSLRPNASFRSFARRTVAQAGRLYGSNSKQEKAVVSAWEEVGISAT